MSASIYYRIVLALLTGGSAATALARPTASEVVCSSMPEAAECAGKIVNCNLCHGTTFPPTWNAFGLDVMNALDRGMPFEDALPGALMALQEIDSDGDGLSNGLELSWGTQPGESGSTWSEPELPQGSPNPFYRVGEYDPSFAFRRSLILYCGRSPTYEQVREFSELTDLDALHERLHEAVDTCLKSAYWSQEGLQRLADKRVRPLTAIGPDSETEYNGRNITVADYYYDYRLWSYVLTGDRDMRELLTAQYHVVEDENGKLTPVEGIIEQPDRRSLGGGQPLVPERRAGMITTQWFLGLNTMLTSLPRTTAAQAYRSYLGADISNNEGLRPVAGEPSDVDNKGVDEARCATCHSTLDPLAYAFVKYEGVGLGNGVGSYAENRALRRITGWSDSRQRPVLFGQEVQDLVEWAQVAANSDDFKRNMASVFFEHALGRKPLPSEQAEFQALFRSLPEDGYSANRLIHRLVDTAAFGAP